MKKILIPIIILIVLGAAIRYYMYNKPVARLDKAKADVSVSASQLLADYEADENAANNKYLGKVLEVSGKIAEISDEEGKNIIHFETSNPISVVITELDEGNGTEGLQPGDQATVKGLCSGYLSDVILVRSSVIK